MKNTLLYIFLLLSALASLASGWSEAEGPLGNCTDCHADIQAVLPPEHMAVEGDDRNIAACMQCHLPPEELETSTRVFSSRVHKAHVTGEASLECSFCHIIEEDKIFALPGRESIGVPDGQTLNALPEIFAEWVSSPYLAARHAKKDVSCSSCHGDVLPLLDDKPSNETCFTCHGSYEEIAVRTPGRDHPSRNPHDSHLGPINCTVCHKVHQYSFAYCLDCHVSFDMAPIPGGR